MALDGKLRILHMIETTGPGGAESVLLSIIKGLDNSRFESFVIVTGKGWLYEKIQQLNVTCILLPSQGANDWRFATVVAKIVRDRGINLIHSHLAGINFYAAVIGWKSACPVITTYHGVTGDWDSKSVKNRIKNYIVKKRSAKIVVVSDYLGAQLSKVWHFPYQKMQKIYNGVDFGDYDTPGNASSLREQFGVPADSYLVGMVGNIRRPKGYPYLVQAARLVVDELPNTRFLIVGEGKGEQLKELTDLISALQLDKIVLLTGFREDIPMILQALDLFVLSSLTEGLSIATIEAMGAGKPVIVTDSGGPAEIVRDGETGLIIRPGDSKSMAEKILSLMRDPARAAKLGLLAKADVRNRFDLSLCVRQYSELYVQYSRKI